MASSAFSAYGNIQAGNAENVLAGHKAQVAQNNQIVSQQNASAAIE